MANHKFLKNFIIRLETKVKNKMKVEMKKKYNFMIHKDKKLQMTFKYLIKQVKN